jgi:hypothetical protein
MHRSWTTPALLTFALGGLSAAELRADSGFDAAYTAEHSGWQTRCAEQLAERHGPSCLIEATDADSGLVLLIVTYDKERMLGEVWLRLPPGVILDERKQLLNVELRATEASGAMQLQAHEVPLMDEGVTYLVLDHPDQVEPLVLENKGVEFEVDLGGNAPLEASFDLAGAAAAWAAVKERQGWK